MIVPKAAVTPRRSGQRPLNAINYVEERRCK